MTVFIPQPIPNLDYLGRNLNSKAGNKIVVLNLFAKFINEE